MVNRFLRKFSLFMAFVLILMCFMPGCNSGINKINNSVMYEKFENTLSTYYSEFEDSSNSINIYSDLSEISSIKTLAMQNLFGLRNIDCKNFLEENNYYIFSLEKSIYENKNYLNLNLLNNNSTEEDYFEAYYVAFKLNDSDLKNRIADKYDKYTGSHYDSASEKIYHYLNQKYLLNTDKNNKQISNLVKENISYYLQQSYFDIDADSLSNICACLCYLYFTKDNVNNYSEQLLSMLETYINEYNEKYMIFYDDVCFKTYLRSIYYLLELTNKEVESEDILYTLAQKGKILYKGVTYDINSCYNLATYVTALVYSDNTITELHLQTLKQLYEQMLPTVDQNNYKDLYYMKYTASLLNINFGNNSFYSIDEFEDKNYYLYKIFQKEYDSTSHIDANHIKDEELINALSMADISTDKNKIKDIIQNIDIMEYENDEDFYVILNLYVAVSQKYNLLSSETKNEIINFINNSKNEFGYVVNNTQSYDFRISVYYTNILYLLSGGYDYGFR